MQGYTFSNTLLIGIRNVTAGLLAEVIDDVLSNIDNGQVSVQQIQVLLQVCSKYQCPMLILLLPTTNHFNHVVG
jgi:hypothetical protein